MIGEAAGHRRRHLAGPDRVALRTYTAAYEWDVPDGDVVKAITTATPRITPLPDEPQGESIAYTADGRLPDRERPAGRPRCLAGTRGRAGVTPRATPGRPRPPRAEPRRARAGLHRVAAVGAGGPACVGSWVRLARSLSTRCAAPRSGLNSHG